jgi:RES domain-containing protein
VIYSAASRSLAVVEILVHYSVLPTDFVITPISLPDSVPVQDVPEAVLVSGWDQPAPMLITQEYGRMWVTDRSSAVLRVPSAVVRLEWNYVINVQHPRFPEITFGPSEPFSFDPRLK